MSQRAEQVLLQHGATPHRGTFLPKQVPSVSRIFSLQGRELPFSGCGDQRDVGILMVSAKALGSLEANNYQKVLYIMHGQFEVTVCAVPLLCDEIS